MADIVSNMYIVSQYLCIPAALNALSANAGASAYVAASNGVGGCAKPYPSINDSRLQWRPHLLSASGSYLAASVADVYVCM